MVIYYTPTKNVVSALFSNPMGTAIYMACSSHEYWLWWFCHIVCIALCKYAFPDITTETGEWKMTIGLQFLAMMFLCFYTEFCNQRFSDMYDQCVKMTNAVASFVEELLVTFHHDDLQRHRLLATKYMLAAVHDFYACLQGKKTHVKSLKHFTDKGLLTGEEAGMLSNYPGGTTVPVLTAWAMLVVKDGLKQDCFWNVPKHKRSGMGYSYERLHQSSISILEASQKIGHGIGFPTPFILFHLVNLMLMVNIFISCWIVAIVRNWYTIVAFSLLLVELMGLRMVSASMADPFGQDSTDFPIPEFVNHCYDRAVCLLEGLTPPEIRAAVIKRVVALEDFDHKKLLRSTRPATLYNNVLSKKEFYYQPPTGWCHIPSLQAMAKEHQKLRLNSGMVDKADRVHVRGRHDAEIKKQTELYVLKHGEEEAEEVHVDFIQQFQDQIEEEKERNIGLKLEVADLKAFMDTYKARTKLDEADRMKTPEKKDVMSGRVKIDRSP